MPLRRLSRPLALAAAALVAGCASIGEAPAERAAAEPAPGAAEARPANQLPALSVDGYKQQAARRIVASASDDAFEGALPEILKSVVVLDITVDRDGKVVKAAVRRSNGYKDLERRALASVRKAGTLPAPSLAVHRGAKTVSYLETWLFRDDGKFQIRSLVVEPQSVASTK